MNSNLSLPFAVVAAFLVAPASEAASGIDTATQTGRIVSVEVVTPDIIRVSNHAPGEQAVHTFDSPLGMLRAQECQVSSTGPVKTFTTSSGVTVRVDTVTGAVDITSGSGRAISDNGIRDITGGMQSLSISTMGGGSFYGAGERGHDFNIAGDTLVMYNRQNYGYAYGDPRISQMNITMPLFLSPKGYAVVFDDYGAATMVMSDPIVYTTESRHPVSYYFVNSPGSLADVTDRLTSLTGRQRLAPFWALGYITSKYGYRTQDETVGVIDTLRRSGYPVDGVVLDLYWYGKEQDMGRLAWDPGQWPDHKKMLADLDKKGVKTVIISQPYVLRDGNGLQNYNELASKGMLLKDSLGNTQEVKIWVGDGGMFDVANPDTRAWLRERYKSLTLDGVGGWWGDLGEPEVHPESGVHANGESARLYHNRYGNDWSSIIHDLYKEEFPDRRLMTLMRGGTIGLQQYDVFPWSTDVSRSWGGLKPQITIMLNSGLSGLGYMSHDVGGFAIDPQHPYDPELYVRWLQLGTFSPVLRTHAQATAEPYKYPDHQNIILPLVRERYRWLPYNYTLAYENASHGYPLVRPLGFHIPESSLYDDITDEYLWGRDVLVAPVLTQGAIERDIVFPEGLWVDYNDPVKIYHGGDTIKYSAPLDILPLFVRAGAFIPQADYAMRNTGDYRTDTYTINYYPYLGKSEYLMYEDDRKSPSSLEHKEYAVVTFTGDATMEGITITASSEGQYPGMPEEKKLRFVVHLLNGNPTYVSVDGKTASHKVWKFDKKSSTLTIDTRWTVDNPLTIHIG